MTDDPALPAAVACIAAHEGFRAQPYLDGRGSWTYGFGFTVTPTGQHVNAATPAVTREAAYERLTSMAARVLAAVRTVAERPLTTHQAAALTSFAYNTGTNALKNSTLLRLLNEGKTEEAAQQFAAWVYAGGHIEPGLVRRREDEAALFLTPDAAEHPCADDLNAQELAKL